MDISIGDKAAGRIVMLLRADVVPKTAGTFSSEDRELLIIIIITWQKISEFCVREKRVTDIRTARFIG